MAQVFLPCESEAWEKDKRLFLLLSKLNSVGELLGMIDDHNRGVESADAPVISQRLRSLRGLAIFLTELATEEEREVFFSRTLPFVCRSASFLEALVPDEGIPYLRQQEGAAVYLGRKLVLSLLANAFLCTFSSEHPSGADIRPFNFDRFFDVFIAGEESQRFSQAGKLRCILNYFQRMSRQEADDIEGMICYTRQVIERTQLPSVNNWQECEYPLCPVTVDNTRGIEDAGSRTLQVDFAASCIGGGTLDAGAVQEEIRFCLCPELLPSMLLMDEMEENEAILVTGYERFSDYKGYGRAFEFAGDHQDPSERDIYNSIRSSLAAIDALSFAHNHRQPQDQYQEKHVLRELNKAYAGFVCRDERGDLAIEQVALSSNYQYSETATTEEEFGNTSIVDTMSVVTMEEEGDVGGEIEKFSENLSSAVIKGAVSSFVEEREREEETVQAIASSLVKGVIEEVLNDQVASIDLANQREGVAHQVASHVVEKAIAEVRHSWEEVSIALPASAHSSTVSRSTAGGEPVASNSMSSYTGQPLLPIEFTDSLVEDVVQSGIRKAAASNPSLPPPVSGTTVAINIDSPKHQPVAPANTTTVSQFASDLVGKTVQDALLGTMGSSPKKTVLTLSSAVGLGGGGGGKVKKSPVTGRRGNSPAKEKSHPFKPSRAASQDSDMLDPRALYPPSSRMSVAWSTTSTRDEGSAPPSPTELDRVALGMVTSVDELATVLVDFVIREAITSATESQDMYLVEEMEQETDRQDSKITTFLHSLQEAGSQFSLDGAGQDVMFPFSPRWHALQKSVLRPVATGNWGSGVFRGDPQLKAMLQWMAISATGRPEMKYYPFSDVRVQQLPEVAEKLLMIGWSVGQLCKTVTDYCSRRHRGDTSEDLFSELLHA